MGQAFLRVQPGSWEAWGSLRGWGLASSCAPSVPSHLPTSALPNTWMPLGPDSALHMAGYRAPGDRGPERGCWCLHTGTWRDAGSARPEADVEDDSGRALCASGLAATFAEV